MAEPFASAVFADEQAKKTEVPGLIKQSTFTPSWEVTPTVNREREQIAEGERKAANGWGIMNAPDTFMRAAQGQTNTAYKALRQIGRAYESGPVDDSWRSGNNKKWLDANRKAVPETDDWRFLETRNEDEANALLADKQEWAENARILQERTGVVSTVAWALPGLIDVDAPITFMTGGLSSVAKGAILSSKAARIAGAAASGGAAGAALGAVDYAADPNGDWSVIPLTGLMGIGFGTLGGAFSTTSRAANAAKRDTLNEFGETMADGHPRANMENMHKETFTSSDPYGSIAAEEFERIEKEKLEKAVVDAFNDIEGQSSAKPDNASGAPTSSGTGPKAFDPSEIEPQGVPDIEVPLDPDMGKGSIGARQLGTTGPGIASITSKRSRDIIQNARTRVRQLGIEMDWLDGWRNVPQYAEGVARQVERFHNVMNRTPIASDFARLMNSGSAVAKTLAYDVFENATGIVRNNRSAARIMEHYHKDLLSKFLPFEESYKLWTADQGVGRWQRYTDSNLRAQFNREVANELQGRYYDGANHVPSQNARVVAAADGIDGMFAREVDIAKGKHGEPAIAGTDLLNKQTGYMPQKWLGRNMKQVMAGKGVSRKAIVQAIAEGYKNVHKNMDIADAKIYADAVVSRAEKFDDGINTNVIGMLSGDGRKELEDVLMRQPGMDPKKVEQFIDRMTQRMNEKGAPGWSKGRLDIDLRFTASNGIIIMDLVDTDFQSMIPKRVRRTAGNAALARKGIRSKADWDEIIDAILAEQTANGKSAKTGTSLRDKASDFVNEDVALNREFLTELYSYFNGDPIGGGISPMYARIKKLTNLALLNQLGLTQIAELGPTVAAVGVESFFRHAGEAFTGMLKDVNSPLVQELKHMNVLVPEAKLFRADLTHEFEKFTTQNEFGRQFDRILNKAQYIQGFTSGFNTMRDFQQRIAVSSAADRLAKHFRDGGLVSDERLFDMGFDQKSMTAFEKYVKNGTVQFDSKGNLVKLNIDKWDAVDAEDLTLILNQRVNTLVQKAMAGESSMLFHKDGLAQLFWHLKSFPMLAYEKQFLRNSRMLDPETAMTFLYGLGTAAAAYTVRQVINGREDNLTWDKIAKGAFGYSNMTGWIPMWTDPLAGMLGMDSLAFGAYGGKVDIVAPLVGIETLNRMLRIPGAAMSAADLSLTNGEINALSATPLIGNLYGFSLMFNMMKDSNTERKEKARKEAREQRAKEQDPLEQAKKLATPLADTPIGIAADLVAGELK